MEKVVVLLTDGNNQFHDNDTNSIPGSDFTAYGRIESPIGSSSGTAASRRDRAGSSSTPAWPEPAPR